MIRMAIEVNTNKFYFDAVEMEFQSLQNLIDLFGSPYFNYILNSSEHYKHYKATGVFLLPTNKLERPSDARKRDTQLQTETVRLSSQQVQFMVTHFKSMEDLLEHWYIGFDISHPFYYFVRDNLLSDFSHYNPNYKFVNKNAPFIPVYELYANYIEYCDKEQVTQFKCTKIKFIRILRACGFKVVMNREEKICFIKYKPDSYFHNDYYFGNDYEGIQNAKPRND